MRWLLGMLEEREGRLRRQEVPAADASAGPCLAPSRGSAPSSDVGAGDAAAGGGAGHHHSKGSPLARYSRGGDVRELIRATATALKGRGIQISSDATMVQLSQGHGEGVCLILNELINQELMGRDFHFEHPGWGCQPALDGSGEYLFLEADDLPEEVGGESGSAPGSGERSAGSGEESDAGSSARSSQQCLVESPAAAGPPLLEPVHVAHVDPGAWREELERVKPHLRISMDAANAAGGWRASVGLARGFCQKVKELGPQTFIPDSVRTCSRQWRDELSRLGGHEDSLNARFGERVAAMAQLRSASATETERLAALQASVTAQSDRLASLVQEVEQVKAESNARSETSLDQERLPRLRKALRRLQGDERELRVHVELLQREVFARRTCAA